MREVVMVSGARTPIGDFLGILSKFSAVQLGTFAAADAIRRAGIDPKEIDNVTGGHCISAGTGGNAARQIQGRLGVPWKAPGMTLHQACASSMRALEIAAADIMLGRSETALIIGMESMSQSPYILKKARLGYRMGDGNDGPLDELTSGTLICPIYGHHMGVTAENIAEKYGISREDQDALAFLSQQRASAATKNGIWRQEITPVEVKTKKGPKIIDFDEHVRDDITLEGLAKLQPAFKKGGTVTPGNASGLNDGAAAAIIMSREKAHSLGLKPICKISAITSYGVEPEIMGIGPVYAIPKALKLAGYELNDVDYYEINEAFAAQCLAVQSELKIETDKLNANGSGISLGHPVGMTGVRLIISLANELNRRGGKVGVASLCAGMGPAGAAVIEAI
ncbi:MAG: thiolase family protein [Syntrophomonadaceae bacterium]